MDSRLNYRVSRKAQYVVKRLERRVEADGRHSGSLRVVGRFETAAEAEHARAALQESAALHDLEDGSVAKRRMTAGGA